MIRTLCSSLMLLVCLLFGVACVTPRPDPRKKSTKSTSTDDPAQSAPKPLGSPKIASWSEEDSELKTAQIYEETFDFDEKKNEWWPVKALPKSGKQLPRLDFINIGQFIVLKTKNRTKMTITFEPVSKDVIKMGPEQERITYFCKIIDVQRQR